MSGTSIIAKFSMSLMHVALCFLIWKYMYQFICYTRHHLYRVYSNMSISDHLTGKQLFSQKQD